MAAINYNIIAAIIHDNIRQHNFSHSVKYAVCRFNAKGVDVMLELLDEVIYN